MRSIDRLLWRVTARNWLGWPVERRHRLTGQMQHIRYNETGKWQNGPLPYAGGNHGK